MSVRSRSFRRKGSKYQIFFLGRKAYFCWPHYERDVFYVWSHMNDASHYVYCNLHVASCLVLARLLPRTHILVRVYDTHACRAVLATPMLQSGLIVQCDSFTYLQQTHRCLQNAHTPGGTCSTSVAEWAAGAARLIHMSATHTYVSATRTHTRRCLQQQCCRADFWRSATHSPVFLPC